MKTQENHGTGALKKPKDARDYQLHRLQPLGGAPQPFNWNSGFDIETKLGYPLLTEDQGESDSCGGQADRYYVEVLHSLLVGTFTRLSAKDPYCQIFYPGGGTDIRSIGKLTVNKGITTEDIVPSYQNGSTPTEAFMEDKTLSNLAATKIHMDEFGFAFPQINIDTIAQAIRDNNGCILQLDGQNNGTWLSSYPNPPTQINGDWSHFVYAGKAKIISGTKYIGIKNSWGDSVGDHGWQWLAESYFTKGYITNALVYYDQNLYNSYSPSPSQTALTWIQKFMQWFNNIYN